MRTIVYDPNEPVVIRTLGYDYEAEFSRLLLSAADIPALLVRDACGGLGTGRVRLAVRRSDAEAALATLDAPATGPLEGDLPTAT
jgi:hypothetical protein